MKWTKRILASLLAIAMVMTGGNSESIAFAGITGGAEETTSVTTENDLAVEATNSFGTLFANTLEAELDEQEENNGCNIFSIEMYDSVAEVSFETTEYATIVVGIYDEAGTKMLASGELEVIPGETTAYVDIDVEAMPEYYYVRGFLIDADCMRPLCSSYESSIYTQEMQEFLAKTTDDFDADKVLNLDEDTTNNFAVYSDETIIIPQTEESNEVTRADDENNTYVIENIDSNISSLQPGDVFAYEYGDGNVLIVKVASISIEGTTATITGEDTSMEEVFDYVKIDETAYTQEVSVDESTCEEGVSYDGEVEVTDDVMADTPQTYAFEGDVNTSVAKKFSFADKKLENNVKLSGSLEFQVTAKIKLYISTSSQYLEVKLDYNAKISASLSGKVECSVPLGFFEVSPIPGVFIKFMPSIVVKVSAKIDVNGQLYGTIGFCASAQDGMKNLTTTPQFKAEIKGEMTVFFGLSMKPEVVIASDNIANASLEATVGAEAKGTITYSTADSTSQKIHDCNACVDGDITAKASAEFKASIFHSDNLTFKLSKTFSIKISDFYFSFDYGEFGFTSCPHCRYKTTFTVTDGSKALQNATIKIADAEITTLTADGKEETVTELITDKDGKAEGYLQSGKYNVTIDVLGYLPVSKKVTVEDKAASVKTVMRTSSGSGGSDSGSGGDAGDGGNDDTNLNDKILKNWQTFSTDGSISGAITEDGSLYMWGYNDDGLVGNGTHGGDTSMPVKVLDDVVSIYIEYGASMAIKEDGSLYAWGYNRYGTAGTGGGWYENTPVKILDNVVNVYMWGPTCAAITEDGSLYIWGWNDKGQVGNGNAKCNQNTPVKILDNVVYVTADESWGHSVAAITVDGSLYMWGANNYGQVGNGKEESIQSIPVKVLDNVVTVSLSGIESGAITEDGSLYMWGNGAGTDGNGSIVNQTTPIKIMDNVVSISIGNGRGAITEDGSLYMWGSNYYGQVGNGMPTYDEYKRDGTWQKVPVKILDNVEKIYQIDATVAAVTEDGSLYRWGYNYEGQVGDGVADVDVNSKVNVPIEVLDNVEKMYQFQSTVAAITEDESLYMWGGNDAGEVGNGNTGNQLTPAKVLNNVASVSMSHDVSGAVTNDGSLYMWGNNEYGQIGNGTYGLGVCQLTPVKILDNVKLPSADQTTDKQQIMSKNLYSAQHSSNGTTQEASFSDLQPNETYNFYVMKDRDAEDTFSSSNLLYITQAVSDTSGNLTVPYEPTEQVEDADIFVVQMSQTDLSSAKIEVADLEYTGEVQYVNPQVTLNGNVLVEGKDYELTGDYSALVEGEYTVTVHGIGLYTGEINVSYKVLNSEDFFAELIQQLTDAGEGTVVQVDFGSRTIVPQKVLEMIRDKDIILDITCNNATSWTINGAEVEDGALKDNNISVTQTSKESGNIPTDTITALVGSRDAEQLIFGQSGVLDFTGQLTLGMTSGITGNKGVLLQQSSTDGSLTYVDSAPIIDNSITFNVSQGDDRAVIYGTNGDTNGDNQVNIKDLMQVLYHVSARTTMNEVQKGFADVDMNNVVNIQDLMRELYYVSGRNSNL